MHDVLDRIVQTKRQEVEHRRSVAPLPELKARLADAAPTRNFFAAVTKPPSEMIRRGAEKVRVGKLMNVIAEVKKASPSAGVIRADFDPVAIAQSYAGAGADAISCLTDEPYFQGKLEYIAQIKSRVSIPVLRKDFIIDPWQVYESRVAGADAILLIAECLATNELIDLQILATELRMTCLIEVHSLENLMRVRDCVVGFPLKSYSLLGINNRDLQSMKVDIAHTLRMLDFVEDRSVLVSESGIQTRQHVQKLSDEHIRAALIGETLMRSGDVGKTLDELFGV